MIVHKPSEKEIELSIIVLSYNTSALTKQTIESIYSTTKLISESFEVIVLDNNSHDNSVEILQQTQKAFSNLKLIISKENLGFSKGNNAAVKQSQGKYLLFLNSDIIVQDNGIDTLFEYLKHNEKEVQFVGGKLFNKDLSPQASCGPFYTLPVVFAALFLRGDYWGLTRSSPDQTKHVEWVSGACLMTRRDVFDSVGGFDEDIFMYMEEIDLLYRARKQGYKTSFVHDAQFIHLGSASSNGRTFPIIQVYRGFLYFYKKHYSSHAVIWLKRMLQLKAWIAIIIGKCTGKSYLTETYGKAQKLVEMA